MKRSMVFVLVAALLVAVVSEVALGKGKPALKAKPAKSFRH